MSRPLHAPSRAGRASAAQLQLVRRYARLLREAAGPAHRRQTLASAPRRPASR